MFGSILILFQVLVLSSWSKLIYHFGYIFDKYTISCVYFISFEVLTVITICSFIKGIVWEIFSFVETELRKIDKIKQNAKSTSMQLKNDGEISILILKFQKGRIFSLCYAQNFCFMVKWVERGKKHCVFCKNYKKSIRLVPPPEMPTKCFHFARIRVIDQSYRLIIWKYRLFSFQGKGGL